LDRVAIEAKMRTTSPGPLWLDGSDKVITARLLLTQDGPKVHWSHYGPLEPCVSEKELESLC